MSYSARAARLLQVVVIFEIIVMPNHKYFAELTARTCVDNHSSEQSP